MKELNEYEYEYNGIGRNVAKVEGRGGGVVDALLQVLSDWTIGLRCWLD